MIASAMVVGRMSATANRSRPSASAGHWSLVILQVWLCAASPAAQKMLLCTQKKWPQSSWLKQHLVQRRKPPLSEDAQARNRRPDKAPAAAADEHTKSIEHAMTLQSCSSSEDVMALSRLGGRTRNSTLATTSARPPPLAVSWLPGTSSTCCCEPSPLPLPLLLARTR